MLILFLLRYTVPHSSFLILLNTLAECKCKTKKRFVYYSTFLHTTKIGGVYRVNSNDLSEPTTKLLNLRILSLFLNRENKSIRYRQYQRGERRLHVLEGFHMFYCTV